MRRATSTDGTRIAFSTVGDGPPIVIVSGALTTRKSGTRLAKLLASELAVTTYDRRGRGSSTDEGPYSPDREADDLRAVIDELGGAASVYAHSSGAAIALPVAAAGDGRVTAVAIYEAPYMTTDAQASRARRYDADLRAALDADDRDAAVALFISHVGVSEKQIAALKLMPMWKGLVAIAHTLRYDSEILGDGQVAPVDLARRVTSPALIMHGEKGADSMRAAAIALADAIPSARLMTVEGQDHGVSPRVIAPILTEFFSTRT